MGKKCVDDMTTTPTLGFRIEGIVSRSKPALGKSFVRTLKTSSDISKLIVDHFLPTPNDASANGSANVAEEAAKNMVKELMDFATALKESPFVAHTSFISCSILFMCEAHAPKCGLALIDFANTTPVPDGIAINHASPWQPGNHEDGIFNAVDNLIAVFEEAAQLVVGTGGSCRRV